MTVKKIFKNKEILVGIIFLIGSLYILYEITQFPVTAERYRSLGPDVFPKFMAGTLCFLSIMLLIQGLRKAQTPILTFNLFSTAALRMFSIIAFLVIYMMFVETIGFILWGLIFMALVQVILGERRPGVIVLISVAVIGAVYLVFVIFLKTPLPKGIFFT